jgi:hypothetical protein
VAPADLLSSGKQNAQQYSMSGFLFGGSDESDDAPVNAIEFAKTSRSPASVALVKLEHFVLDSDSKSLDQMLCSERNTDSEVSSYFWAILDLSCTQAGPVEWEALQTAVSLNYYFFSCSFVIIGVANVAVVVTRTVHRSTQLGFRT